MLPYVQKIESGSRVLACYWLIPHSNFTLDTFQYYIDNAVMMQGGKLKLEWINRAQPRLRGCFAAVFFFFRWGEFQGEKVSRPTSWSPIRAKLSSTLPPLSPLFLMYHHKSMQPLENRFDHTHACTHARTEVRCLSPLTLGGGTHTPVCNRVGIIYCQVTSGHFIPRDPPQKWLSIFNLLKLSSY